MQKLMRMIHKEEKGFTLVELMVVVVIIGVLVAIAIPIYNGIQQNARDNAHEANIRILRGAAAMYISEEGAPAADETWDGTAAQNWETYIDEWPTVPDGTTDAWGSYSVTIGSDASITVADGG